MAAENTSNGPPKVRSIDEFPGDIPQADIDVIVNRHKANPLVKTAAADKAANGNWRVVVEYI